MTTGSGLIILQDECEAVWRAHIEESLSRLSMFDQFIRRYESDTAAQDAAEKWFKYRQRGAHRYPHLGVTPRMPKAADWDDW